MEKRKNIAILVKNLTVGGAEKQSILLAKSLADKYQVHYIVFNGDIFDQKYLDWLREDNLIHIAQLHGNVICKFILLCRYLKKQSVEVLFSYLTAANFYAALAGYKIGIKQIYTGIRNARLPWMKLQIDRFIGNYIATKVILNCYSGIDYYINRGYRREKLIVIPNCFEKIGPYIERPDNDPVRIITVGRFVPEKDYHTALAAMVKLKEGWKNVVYQIVGCGKLETPIRQWVKELRLEDMVEIYINPGYIPTLLKNADIYLSTSLIEGTSNSIMEALNASLPVVSTDAGDSPELVKDGINGYLIGMGDMDGIVLKMNLLLSDARLRNEMGVKGNELLRKNYSVDIFRTRYINLIENR